jgi:glycosyltransferase involved in cell wall biosynthesis
VRVTFVSADNSVNASYRAYLPANALRERGLDVRHQALGERSLDVAALMNSDVIHVHRFLDKTTAALLARARAAGIAIVWDNDDDVANVPRSNPNYARFGGLNAQRLRLQLREMVRLADVVTTPSAALAQQYREIGASDVRIIENHLPDVFCEVKGRRHDGVVLAWVAALEHQSDLQHLGLQATFRELLEQQPDVRILSVGLSLGLGHDRYEHVPQVPFDELARLLAGCDVGIAPLAASAWNEARSNVKLKEYGAAELAWLASPIGPYRGMGEAEGGMLVDDDAWGPALRALATDDRRRRKLAKRARKWARSQTVGRNVGLWETALRDARAHAARRGHAA